MFRPRARPASLALFLAAVVGLSTADDAPGRVLLTVEEALELAFPDCVVERGTVYLTAEQSGEIRELAGEELATRIVHPYRATCEGGFAGTAYFDAHRVRTLPETLMVVVDPGDEVRRIEILAFAEPPDYIPREAWYEQFEGRALDDELELHRAIRPVTGATLTAVSTTAAVRRVLAIHRVISEGEAREAEDAPR